MHDNTGNTGNTSTAIILHGCDAIEPAARAPKPFKPSGKRPKLKDPRLSWRPGSNSIYCWVPDPTGKTTPGGKPLTVFLSTFARDEAAASAKADEYERKALKPGYRASFAATLASEVELFCDFMLTMESKAHPGKRVKPETVAKVKREKLGMLLRYAQDEKGFSGGAQPLSHIDREWVDGYIKWRAKAGSGRKDGSRVSNYTIKRELNYLRALLEEAKANRRYAHDLVEVFPSKRRFAGACRRVNRYPSKEETTLILANLWGKDRKYSPERAAHIAFLIGTGARWKESVMARRSDIDLDAMVIHMGGEKGDAKNANSSTSIPITSVMAPILRFVLDAAPGKGPADLLFWPWMNGRGQLARVCKRLGIPKYSVHDFRRAFTHLHLDAGIDYSNASLMLRHGPGGEKLVESTYGKIDEAERKRARVVAQMTNAVSLPVLPPTTRAVGNLSVSDAVSASNQSHESHDSAENSRIAEESDDLTRAVHGRVARSTELSGILQDAVRFVAATVGNLSAAQIGGCKAPIEAPPPGPTEAAMRLAEGGISTLAEAAAVLARFVVARSSGPERDALAEALAILTPTTEAAE